uniref:Putative secreted protein n=1 Tax=Ixodes ricinus TaxID=34613 RepID=A0A6B0UHL0_IXORI
MSASFRFFTVLIFTVSVNSYMFLIFFFSSVSPIISFIKMLNSQLYIKCQCKNLFTFCFSVLFQNCYLQDVSDEINTRLFPVSSARWCNLPCFFILAIEGQEFRWS